MKWRKKSEPHRGLRPPQSGPALSRQRWRQACLESLEGRRLMAADLVDEKIAASDQPAEVWVAFASEDSTRDVAVAFDASSAEEGDVMFYTTALTDSLDTTADVFDVDPVKMQMRNTIADDSGVVPDGDELPVVYYFGTTSSGDEKVEVTELDARDVSDAEIRTLSSNMEPPLENTSVPWQWTNVGLPEDVNGDNAVTPLDVLLVVNALNLYGTVPTASLAEGEQSPTMAHWDVNADSLVSPLDALWLANFFNSGGQSTALAVQETLRSMEPTDDEEALDLFATHPTELNDEEAIGAGDSQSMGIVADETDSSATARLAAIDAVYGETSSKDDEDETAWSDLAAY